MTHHMAKPPKRPPAACAWCGERLGHGVKYVQVPVPGVGFWTFCKQCFYEWRTVSCHPSDHEKD